MSPSAPSQNGSDAVLAELIDEFTNRMQAGESVDVESYAQRHPEHADRLRQLLPALALLAEVGRSEDRGSDGVSRDAAEGSLTGTLGDFRILREVGRGGMGVVYEAEQISLRRRVALKVLPFAATMDARHLQRFHNEAQAAACLHHTNIVPVFSVGCERGVHFYAMQFIDGQPLAELIAAQREDSASGERRPSDGMPDHGVNAPCSPAPATQPMAAATTPAAPRAGARFRRIAEWGIQAAEALEHAHGLGIVHRDVKPGNLMIDGTGRLWVTDFGLARTATDAGLTMTGDVLGTLRYMSPEQALAKHGLVDHRTDIYALGATLYELLTLRPAIEAENREEILRKIAFEEVSLPRSLDRTIPTDLETIAFKALAKEPAERYATAQEMADDLRFFLQHKPIRAKLPSLAKRVRKCLRRHQAATWAAGAGLIVALFILSVSSLLLWQEKERVKLALTEKETQRRLAEEQTTAADKQRRRAEANFGKALDGMTMLLEQLDEKEWPLPVRIEQVRQTLGRHLEDFFQRFLVENADEPLARLEIGWAYQHMGVFHLRRGDLARAEQNFRTALTFHEALAADYPDDPASVWMYAQSLDRLAYVLHVTGHTREAHDYFLQASGQYRRQLRMHPDWRAYHALAWFLVTCPDAGVRDTAEAVHAAFRAVELAPDSLVCRGTLGRAQYRNGDWKSAVDTLQDCLRCRRGEKSYDCFFVADCFFLAMAYEQLGDREQARYHFERGMQPIGPERAPYVTVQHIRTEAAALLGLKGVPAPDKEEAPPKE